MLSVKYSESITFSVILVLKPGFHSGISLVASEIFVSETQKKIIVPKSFDLIYSFEIVGTDDHFDNQTGVD